MTGAGALCDPVVMARGTSTAALSPLMIVLLVCVSCLLLVSSSIGGDDGFGRSRAETCTARCIGAGHCCTGNSSGCQRPSCQIGCNFGAGSPDEAACNATCATAHGCSFAFHGQSYPMCGGCSLRWMNPETLLPEILPGKQPWWPPGFNLPGCGSCDAVENECMLGCALYFNAGLVPTPPVPPVPPPTPLPAAPWPNTGTCLNFSAVLSSHMVLQQAPAKAAVYGPLGESDGGAAVSVMVTSSDPNAAPYTVNATVEAGRWKAFLCPTPQSATTTYTISASCTAGCKSASVTLHDVVFGDVWYCAGREFAYGGAPKMAAVRV